MKIIKIILLILWVLCTAIFIIGVLTPLEFKHRFMMYVAFFVSFNGAFYLAYLLTDFISIKMNNVMVGFIGAVILIGAYEFYPKFGSGWRTQQILYKQKDNSDNVIAFQENDMGSFGMDHRTVKIIQCSPLFEMFTELKKVEVNDEWEEVNAPVKKIK